MSAKIIQFPLKQLPSHWTGADNYRFQHHRESGLSVEQATEAVEQYRHVTRKVAGETEIEAVRRQAREAFALMGRMQG